MAEGSWISVSYFKREGGSCESSTASFQDMRGNRRFERVSRPTWRGKPVLEKERVSRSSAPKWPLCTASPSYPCALQQREHREGYRRGRERGRETGGAARGGEDRKGVKAEESTELGRVGTGPFLQDTKEGFLTTRPKQLSCSSL